MTIPLHGKYCRGWRLLHNPHNLFPFFTHRAVQLLQGIILTRENFKAAVNRVVLVPYAAEDPRGGLRTTDVESEERGRRSVDVSRARERAKNWPQGVRTVAGGTMSPEGPLGRRSRG